MVYTNDSSSEPYDFYDLDYNDLYDLDYNDLYDLDYNDLYDHDYGDDDDDPAKRTIFIRDLPTHTTHGEIINIFSTIGPIEVSL
jgi:hypothetical protein